MVSFVLFWNNAFDFKGKDRPDGNVLVALLLKRQPGVWSSLPSGSYSWRESRCCRVSHCISNQRVIAHIYRHGRPFRYPEIYRDYPAYRREATYYIALGHFKRGEWAYAKKFNGSSSHNPVGVGQKAKKKSTMFRPLTPCGAAQPTSTESP
jgi:hypothetical protein